MASEQFVDVTYRGLEVGSTLKMVDFGPATAYLELKTPMPVGTELSIETDTGISFAARVLRVQEQVAGADAPPGMRIVVSKLKGAAADWWKPNVAGTDPAIPEPRVELAPLAAVESAASGEGDGEAAAGDSEAAAVGEAEVKADATGEAGGAEVQPAADGEAAAGDGAAAAAEGNGKRGKKRSSRTQVMDVAQIQAAIAAGGDVADLEESIPKSIEDARATEQMAAVAAADSGAASSDDGDGTDAEGKKKKKRRRRRKRRTTSS